MSYTPFSQRITTRRYAVSYLFYANLKISPRILPLSALFI